MATLVQSIKDLGFNCVRLPYTVEQVLTDPAVPLASGLPKAVLAANPELLGLSSLEVFDKTIEALTDAGIMIILNVHTSASVWCCQLSSYEGIWETPEWTLSQFEKSLVDMTVRYKANPLVVAIDLRNEIHDVNPPDGSSTPVGWGRGDEELDWAIVSKRVGNLVLSANPDVLVIVTALCFGMDLRGCKSTGAIELSVPNKLVWTVHSYRFFTPFYDIPWAIGLDNYADLAGISFGLVALFAGLLAVFLWKVTVSREVKLNAFFGAWVSLMFVTTLSAFLAAEVVLKRTCNTWYHNDAKYMGPILLCITMLPIVVWTIVKIRSCRSPPAETGESSILMVDIATDLSRNSSDNKPIANADSKFVSFVKMKTIATLTVLLTVSTTSLAWSLVATTPAVYANFNDRMWGFASHEDKSYTAPIWMSEFGADTRDSYWVALITYLAKTDMDWAVWAYYGATRYEQVLDEDSGKLVNVSYPESYGLMNEDYSDTQFRNEEGKDWRIMDMQAVMPKGVTLKDIEVLNLKASDGVW
jgi:hypothetical protein